MTKRTSDPAYRKRRAEVLEGSPLCHWCKRAPATEADHLIEYDIAGDDSPLVPACKPCNSRRGAEYLSGKRTHQQRIRENALAGIKPENNESFLISQNPMPPTPSLCISKDQAKPSGVEPFPALGSGIASDLPRLMTPPKGEGTYGPLIAAFSENVLGRRLFPWQVIALEHAFSVEKRERMDLDTGTAEMVDAFTYTTALLSCGRQSGKTTMVSAIVGFALLELPRIWGRPVKIVSTAHELSLATEVFEDLRDTFELWEESELCKVTWAYGRHKVVMKDGSTFLVKAATAKKHGISGVDILIVDELWAITEAAYFGALKPAQIAVFSPLAFLVSTAGDESSRTFSKLREQGLGIIDSGKAGEIFMAEWSLPPGVDPMDENYWGYANPSLGRTITLKGLRAAAASPDRSQFLRAHCNLWVSAASSWMPPGTWAQRLAGNATHDGERSVLAVDSALDESKYVGVWARLNTDGQIITSIAFSTESNITMWDAIDEWMSRDPKLVLAITPTLDLHTPYRYETRKQIWGYGELLKYTGLVRSLILEDRLRHTGEEMLSEHINRAVLTRAQGSVVISSQRSPGPIECARCLIAAAAFVSRPRQSKKPSMGVSRG